MTDVSEVGRRTLVAAACSLLMCMSACTPTPEEFEAADYAGYNACVDFDELTGTPGPYMRSQFEGGAAGWAVQSTTPEIRANVDPSGRGIADFKGMTKACKRAGYRFTWYAPGSRA